MNIGTLSKTVFFKDKDHICIIQITLGSKMNSKKEAKNK